MGGEKGERRGREGIVISCISKGRGPGKEERGEEEERMGKERKEKGGKQLREFVFAL